MNILILFSPSQVQVWSSESFISNTCTSINSYLPLPTWQVPNSPAYFQLESFDVEKTMISIAKTCLRGIYSCHWNSENERQNVRFYSDKRQFSLTLSIPVWIFQNFSIPDNFSITFFHMVTSNMHPFSPSICSHNQLSEAE